MFAYGAEKKNFTVLLKWGLVIIFDHSEILVDSPFRGALSEAFDRLWREPALAETTCAQQLEGTVDNYPLENSLKVEDFKDSQINVVEGPMITVLGTSLQNKNIL